MPVTPGAVTKLNRLAGVSKILSVTATEMSTYGARVLEAGLIVKRADGKLLLTDGVTALNALFPIVDQTLIACEKNALSLAFDSNGTYQAAAGGVVVHDSDAKVADAELHVVDAQGHIVNSYLANITDNDGMIRMDKLPLAARAGVAYYANYTAMAAGATEDQKRGAFFVIDATDDPSGQVGQGSAMYVWVPAEGTEGQEGYVAAHFLKIGEVESLDLDIDALTPSTENLEASGAVIYNHTVLLDSPTLTDLAGLENTLAPAPAASGD